MSLMEMKNADAPGTFSIFIILEGALKEEVNSDIKNDGDSFYIKYRRQSIGSGNSAAEKEKIRYISSADKINIERYELSGFARTERGLYTFDFIKKVNGEEHVLESKKCFVGKKYVITARKAPYNSNEFGSGTVISVKSELPLERNKVYYYIKEYGAVPYKMPVDMKADQPVNFFIKGAVTPRIELDDDVSEYMELKLI